MPTKNPRKKRRNDTMARKKTETTITANTAASINAPSLVSKEELEGMTDELRDTLNEYDAYVYDRFDGLEKNFNILDKSMMETRTATRELKKEVTGLREVVSVTGDTLAQEMEQNIREFEELRARFKAIEERMVTGDRLLEELKRFVDQDKYTKDLAMVFKAQDVLKEEVVGELERFEGNTTAQMEKVADKTSIAYSRVNELDRILVDQMEKTDAMCQQMDVVEDDLCTVKSEVHRETGWSIILAGISAGLCVAMGAVMFWLLL